MSTQDANTEPYSETVDRTPAGHAQQAALPSGEVMQEYGVVDLNSSFPSERYEWEPEFPNPPIREQHVVVPFRVVVRGFRTRRAAEASAERRNEEGGSFKAVLLSDMRGM